MCGVASNCLQVGGPFTPRGRHAPGYPKKQRNKNSQMMKKAKREYENKLLKRFKDKPKLFYSYVMNKQKVKPEISQFNTGDGIMTSSDE